MLVSFTSTTISFSSFLFSFTHSALCLVFFQLLATTSIHKNIKSYYNEDEQLNSSSSIADQIPLTSSVRLFWHIYTYVQFRHMRPVWWYHTCYIYILRITRFLLGCLWVESRVKNIKLFSHLLYFRQALPINVVVTHHQQSPSSLFSIVTLPFL